MGKSRKIGDQHVLDVAENLKYVLTGKTLTSKNETTIETVNYIIGKFQMIKAVNSKFDKHSSDKYADLTLTLQDGSKIDINLFIVKGKAKIQPKNLGALSFLKKYFLEDDIQNRFNHFFEREHLNFLKEVVSRYRDYSLYTTKTELKKIISKDNIKFTEIIEPLRQNFLFSLREYCYELLRQTYNKNINGLNYAFRILLLQDSINIITRYNSKNKCLCVEEINLNSSKNNKVSIYKKGKNSLGIAKGNIALLIRFKFESSPSSSIKLATSYEEFESATRNIVEINKIDIQSFENLIHTHKQINEGNKSNAIGKCNEAIIYYAILKENLSVKQVDPDEYKEMFSKYSILVPTSTIHDLLKTASEAVRKLSKFLSSKYSVFTLEGLQLVPDSYINDRLDTSDLKVILIVDGKIIEEKFSIKAYSKKVKKLTSKNPGVGTILGDQYFGIGSMDNVIAETKEAFSNKQFDHNDCLVKVSQEIGKKLSIAKQHELKRGIKNLLGEKALIISFYSQFESLILEHGNINSEVSVLENYPSPIQTTLYWNDNNEELSLRVKFSSGQSKGWSSLKLSCEVKIN